MCVYVYDINIGGGGDDCVSTSCETELNGCFADAQCVTDISYNISLCEIDDFIESYCNDPDATDGRCNDIFDALVTCVVDECFDEECNGGCMDTYCRDPIDACFASAECIADIDIASNQSTCSIPDWKEEYCAESTTDGRCGDLFIDVFDCFIANCYDDECDTGDGGSTDDCGIVEDHQCDSNPCDCSTDSNCDICHSNGCSQCASGYFKKQWDYECTSCSDTFGEGCMFCQDFNGCGQCQQGYDRYYNNDCGLWDCELAPTPAPVTMGGGGHELCIDTCEAIPCDCAIGGLDEDVNCDNCQSWGCQTCADGYFKRSLNHPCMSCDQVYEGTCSHCQDYQGCTSCNSGYTWEWNNDCQLGDCV